MKTTPMSVYTTNFNKGKNKDQNISPYRRIEKVEYRTDFFGLGLANTAKKE